VEFFWVGLAFQLRACGCSAGALLLDPHHQPGTLFILTQIEKDKKNWNYEEEKVEVIKQEHHRRRNINDS
jgi:hypothetical protein